MKVDTSKPKEAKDRLIHLDVKREAITLDPAMTAVIVVDMQNDFGSKGGMFDRAGIDISGIQKAVGPTVKVLAAARKMGIKIIYLKMGYKPDLSDLGAPNSVNRVRHLRLGVGEKITAPDGNESRILIRDTWNTDIVPELEPQAGDDVVYKTRFSGFFETDLDARLKKLGVTHIYPCGFNRPRRDVQGLPVRVVGRQHERANRPWIATKQSGRLAPECRDGARLDLGLGAVPESRPAVIETHDTRFGPGRPNNRVQRTAT